MMKVGIKERKFNLGYNLKPALQAFIDYNALFMEETNSLLVNNIALRDDKGKFIENLTTNSPVIQEIPETPKSFSERLDEVLDRPTVLSAKQSQELKAFLMMQESMFSDKPGRTDLGAHVINTGNHCPIYRSPYPETPERRKIIETEIQKMLELDLIRPSTSAWSSPVTLVKKADGSTRFCIDYRALNKVTLSDQYPMPNMSSMLQQLGGAKYLSSLDMVMGYYQCPMAQVDMCKTAFTCSAGLFEYKVMPFGLKTAPSTFNRLMSKVLETVRHKSALAYLDDIIVYSPTFEQHLVDIDRVFTLLRQAGLFIKLKKCQFCCLDLKFLGSIVKNGQILVDPAKMASINSFKRPGNLKEVQRFLGFTGWLRRHVKNYAQISRPLSALTAGKSPKKTFKWSDQCEEAFINLKKILVEPGTALFLPDFDKPFTIECDAAQNGIAGILRQEGPEGELRVVEYASRILKRAEIDYTVCEQECLAVLFSIRKFRPYIADRRFTVITDHSALRWLLKTRDLRGRLTRWSLKMQEYDYDIQYRKGSANVIADGLSRGTTIEPTSDSDSDSDRMFPPQGNIQMISIVEIPVQFTSLTKEQILEEQAQVPWMYEKVKEIKALRARDPSISKSGNYYVVDGMLYYKNLKGQENLRVVIPDTLIYPVLEELHGDPSGGHFGREKTSSKIKARAFWHKMEGDIASFVQTCEICQLTKHPNKILRGPMQCNIVTEPMQLWALDIMGPYTRSSRQNKYLLVIVDHFSKWLEVFPMRNSHSKTVAKFLVEAMGRWGAPQRLLSDNGPQFISNVYAMTCKIWGTKDIRTSFYQPGSNPTERSNKTIKRLIRSYILDNHQEWDRYIPQFLLAVHTTVNTTTGYSPARLFVGRELNLPWDAIHRQNSVEAPEQTEEYVRQQQRKADEIKHQVQETIKKHKEQQKTQYDKKSSIRFFKPGDCVKIKNFVQSNAPKHFSASLSRPWRGPYFIKDRTSELSYTIVDRDGRPMGNWNIVNIDNYYEREINDNPRFLRGPDPVPVKHTHQHYTRSNKGQVEIEP